LLATLTAVQPPGRFGTIVLHENQNIIEHFREKEKGDGAWINGGFFVLEPSVIDYIGGDKISWEREPLEAIAGEQQLAAYRHEGFWQPMDTLRDKMYLEKLWASSDPPWKIWV
jgi:glucose-1-phosphate cytidylyltransferase